MGLLSELFKSQVAKMQGAAGVTENNFDVGYPTHFLGFDFLNGNVVTINRVDGTSSKYMSIGLVDGSITTLIGRSGCGKTTFAIQSASNIIKGFLDANMYIDSVEGGITMARLSTLTGWTGQELRNRVISRNLGITAESFYQRVKLIRDIKVENREKLSYDTGLLDDLGRPIIKLIPTPYILDSLAMLMPETYSDESELSGQMAATAAAKTNTRLLKMLVPMLKEANIMLILINHINQKVELNAFARTKSQVAYLKPDETMPGGNAAIYLANNIMRLDDTKLKLDQGFRISGSIITLELVKSRTNCAGRKVDLIFCQETGFDADLSMYILLKNAGLIEGAGAFFHLKNSNIKFTQKGFKEKLANDPALKEEFITVAYNYLKDTLIENEASSTYNSYDATTAILNRLALVDIAA